MSWRMVGPLAGFVIILVLLASLLFLIPQSSRKQARPPESGQSGSNSIMRMTGVGYTEYENGELKLAIKANSFDLMNKKVGFFRVALLKTPELRDVKLEFYDRGKVIFTIESERAIVNDLGGDMTFERNVTGRSADGRILRAARLHWIKKTNGLVAEGSLNFKAADQTLQGKKLITDVGFKRVAFK